MFIPQVKTPKEMNRVNRYWHYNWLPQEILRPQLPFSEEEMLRRRAENATKQFLQSQVQTLYDPGINPAVAKRAQKETGIDDTGFRQGMQTAGSIAGVPLGAYWGSKVGAGMAAKAGAIAGGKVGAKVGSIVPIKGTAIGAAAGVIVGGISGYFTGKAAGGTVTPSGMYSMSQALLDKVLAFGQSPVGGTLESLSMMGNTIDQLWGAPVVKAGVLALQGEDDVTDTLKQAYGDHEEGFTRLEFAEIRKNTGLDIGSFGNGIVDFMGEMATDPGIVKSLFMGGVHRGMRNDGEKVLRQFADPNSVTAAVGEGGRKRISQHVLDGLHNKQKALKSFKNDMKGDAKFREWWAKNGYKINETKQKTYRVGIDTPPNFRHTMDEYLENLYEGYSKTLLSELPEGLTSSYKMYTGNVDAADELVGRINKRVGYEGNVHDLLADNLKVLNNKYQRVFSQQDINFYKLRYPSLRKAEEFDRLTVKFAHRMSNPMLFGGVKGLRSIMGYLRKSPSLRKGYSEVSRFFSQGRQSYADIKMVDGTPTIKLNNRYKEANKMYDDAWKEYVKLQNDFAKAKQEAKGRLKEVSSEFKKAQDEIWDNYHKRVKQYVTDEMKRASADLEAMNNTYIHMSNGLELGKHNIKRVKKRLAKLSRDADNLTIEKRKELDLLSKAVADYNNLKVFEEVVGDHKTIVAHLKIAMDQLTAIDDAISDDYFRHIQLQKGKKTITYTNTKKAKEMNIDAQLNNPETPKENIKILQSMRKNAKDETVTKLYDSATVAERRKAAIEWANSVPENKDYIVHMGVMKEIIEDLMEASSNGAMSLEELSKTSKYFNDLYNRVMNHKSLKLLKDATKVQEFKRKATVSLEMQHGIDEALESMLSGSMEANGLFSKYIGNSSIAGQIGLSRGQKGLPETAKNAILEQSVSTISRKAPTSLTRNQLNEVQRVLGNRISATEYDAKHTYETIQKITGMSMEDTVETVDDFFSMVKQSTSKIKKGEYKNLHEILDIEKEPIRKIFKELGIDYSPEVSRLEKNMQQSLEMSQADLFSNPKEMDSINLEKYSSDHTEDIIDFMQLDETSKLETIQDTLQSRKALAKGDMVSIGGKPGLEMTLDSVDDNTLLDLINDVYSSDFHSLGDLEKSFFSLDQMVVNDTFKNMYINGQPIDNIEFVKRYGLPSHREELEKILAQDVGDYVKYKKIFSIQDEIATQFDYFQTNKNVIHLDYAFNDDFNTIIDNFVNAFEGNADGESIFGLISDMIKESPTLSDQMAIPDSPINKMLTNMKNAVNANRLVKNAMSSPKVEKHREQLMAPMYDYINRLKNENFLKVNDDGILTWAKTTGGTWDEEEIVNVLSSISKKIRNNIDNKYMKDATPELKEAMNEVYNSIDGELRRRFMDVFENRLDSEFAGSLLYGEVNSRMINDMYDTISQFSKSIMESDAGDGRKIKQFLGDGLQESSDIRAMQEHIQELKELLGEHRHSLRVSTAHNQQLKRFLFTTSGTHTKIDTPQLFDISDLPTKGTAFTYRQSQYKRDTVKLKRKLNKHIEFNNDPNRREDIMGQFAGGAPTPLGETTSPKGLDRLKDAMTYNRTQLKDLAPDDPQIPQLRKNIEQIQEAMDKYSMEPNVFKIQSKKYDILTDTAKDLLSPDGNTTEYNIYTFYDMLDDYYSAPHLKSRSIRGAKYFEELAANDPGLEQRIEEFYARLAYDRFDSFRSDLSIDGVKAAYGRYKLEYYDSLMKETNPSWKGTVDFVEDYAKHFKSRLKAIKSEKEALKRITGRYEEVKGVNKDVMNILNHTSPEDLKNTIRHSMRRKLKVKEIDQLVEDILKKRETEGALDLTDNTVSRLRWAMGSPGEWKTYTKNELELKDLNKKLMELREGKMQAPEHLRVDEQALETKIRRLERAKDKGPSTDVFETEFIQSELKPMAEAFKQKAERESGALKKHIGQIRENMWGEFDKRYGHHMSSEFNKVTKGMDKQLIDNDFDGFIESYIKAAGKLDTPENLRREAESLIELFKRRMRDMERNPIQEMTMGTEYEQVVSPGGLISYKKVIDKQAVDITDAAQISTQDLIKNDWEFSGDIVNKAKSNLARKKFGKEFSEFVEGADSPGTFNEFFEDYARKFGEDLPFIRQQNAIESFYDFRLDQANTMFRSGHDLNDFLKYNDEYVLVATVPDSSAAAKGPSKYRKGFEGEKVHEGTRKIIHGPDKKVKDPYTKVSEGDVVLRDGRKESTEGISGTLDKLEEAAFIEGRYDTNKPTVKKVMYTADELDDLMKSNSPMAGHIGIMTKDSLKTATRMSYRDYKLPPVLDYYFKNILRLQKQDILINSSWHLTNTVDVMRKNSQMLEGVWDTKEYVNQFANAWEMYNGWSKYKNTLIDEVKGLEKFIDDAILNDDIMGATLGYNMYKDLSDKGLVGYIRAEHGEEIRTQVYRKWHKKSIFKKLSKGDQDKFIDERMDDHFNLLEQTDHFQTTSATTDLPEFIRKMDDDDLYGAMSLDRWVFRHLAMENPVMKANMKAGTVIEQVGRLHGYLLDTHLFGTTPNRAVANSLKRHFDYGDRTMLELYATLVFPFNAFPTRNALFWTDQLEKATNSRRYYHTLNALWGSYDDQESNDYAKYMKSKGYIPVGNTLVKLGDSRSMAMDMGSAFTQTASNRLNPLIKGPIESLRGGDRSLAESVPLLRRIPQAANQIQNIKDKGASHKTLLPGLFGTIYNDSDFQRPVFRKRVNVYNQLFNSSGNYRQMSNNAYYRVRQIQHEQHRRRGM